MNRQTNTTQFFYQNGKLVTVNQGGQHRAIFRSADIPLAEFASGVSQAAGLLEVDQNGSVLKVSGEADDEESHCYSAYGHDPSLPSQRTSSGFNGEQVETVAAAYLLGNGYRLFSPRLLRFHSADSISPFGNGGLNAYAYCGGDPVNNTDPTGHYSLFKSITGGYNTSRLVQRYHAAKPTLRVFAEAKHRSMSKNEYTILNRNVQSQVEHLSKKVEKYTAINRPVYSGKTMPGNTSAERQKLRLYENQLSNIKSMQDDLLNFKRIWPDGLHKNPRYMSPANHERYKNLLEEKPAEPAAAPRGSLIYDANDQEFQRQYMAGVPVGEIRRPHTDT